MAVYQINAGTHTDRRGPNGARRHFRPKDRFNSPDNLLRFNYILGGDTPVPSVEKFTRVADQDDPKLADFLGTAGLPGGEPPARPTPPAPSPSDYDAFPLEQMDAADLKRFAEENEIPVGKAKTKDELVRAIRQAGAAGGGGAA